MPIAITADMLVTSDGVPLRVLENGFAEAPVTAVFVHGWTLSSQYWNGVVNDLLDNFAEVRIVRFDLRGHGESGPAPRGSATIERCADDIAEVISDRVPTGPIVLIGHSMGGMSLLALADRHPALVAERVVGVGLVATSGGDLKTPGYEAPKLVAHVINGVERLGRRPLSTLKARRLSRQSGWLRLFLRWLLFGSRPNWTDVKRSAEWVAACHPASIPAFRISLAEHERIAALAAFRPIPTAIFAGGRDRLCPPVHAYRMAEQLPNARLWLYGGAGHMLALERQPELSARLAGLLREATDAR